jgi:hypothetical protein
MKEKIDNNTCVSDNNAGKEKMDKRMYAEKHGFSQCINCKAKLMYYLESKKPTLEQVMTKLQRSRLKRREKPIKELREYTQIVIRETTGYGVFDNYIIKNRLWTVRQPVLATGRYLEQVEEKNKKLYIQGKAMYEVVERVNAKDPCLIQVTKYIQTMGHVAFINRLMPLMVEEDEING